MKIFKLFKSLFFVFLFVLLVYISLSTLAGCGLFYYDRMNSLVSDTISADNNTNKEYGDSDNDRASNNDDADKASGDIYPYTDTEIANIFLVSEVIDGDTFIIEDGDERIRLLGINTPEIDRYYYEEARDVLKIIIEDKKVRLEKDITDRDNYGRLLRYAYVGELFVNLEMVKRGFANVFTMPPDIKYTNIFLEAERFARKNEIGLWEKSRTSGIKISLNYDSVGGDKKNLNGEYIILENSNSFDINIDGWSIKDSATNIYDFNGFIFKSNSKILLYTGSGEDNYKEGKFFWNSSNPVWNNDHDTLYLRNRQGLLVEIYNY